MSLRKKLAFRMWCTATYYDLYSGSAMWGHGLDWAGSGAGQVVGTCECGNEPL